MNRWNTLIRLSSVYFSKWILKSRLWGDVGHLYAPIWMQTAQIHDLTNRNLFNLFTLKAQMLTICCQIPNRCFYGAESCRHRTRSECRWGEFWSFWAREVCSRRMWETACIWGLITPLYRVIVSPPSPNK